MRLIRQLNIGEWNTLESIKKGLQNFVAKSLADKGRPTNPIHSINVPSVTSVDEVLFKTKDKL